MHTQAACHAIAAGTQARVVKIPNTARPCCAAAVFSFDTVAQRMRASAPRAVPCARADAPPRSDGMHVA